MANDTYTEDLGGIMQSARERRMVAEILNAWNANGLPDTFDSEGARFAFNRNSGNVFLVNADYQCAVMNGDKLERFYNTPYNGEEGFVFDLLGRAPSAYHEEDAEYIRDIARSEGIELPEEWRVK